MAGNYGAGTTPQPGGPRTTPRPLTEEEKWGKPVPDDWHGSVRPRTRCQIGGKNNPYLCATPATWFVGRKKVCKRHVELAQEMRR